MPILQDLGNWYQKSQKWFLPALIILSSLIFLLVAAENPTVNENKRLDDPWQIARSIERGKGYSACEPNYFPYCKNGNGLTAMREPVMVFQFLLAIKLLGISTTTALLVEYLLFIGVMVSIFYLIQHNHPPHFAALASLFWIFYIPLKNLIHNNTGDLSATFWFILGFIFIQLWKKSNKIGQLLFAGIAFGLATLSRSAMVLPTAVVCGFVVLERGSSKQIITRRQLIDGFLVVFAVSLVVLPWLYRNYIVFGKPMMSSLTGYNLFRHNAPIQKADFLHYVKFTEAQIYQRDLLQSLTELSTSTNEAEFDQIYRDAAIKIIAAHPFRYLALSAYRAIPLWFNIGVPDKWTTQDTVVIIQQSILLILFLAGILFSKPRPWMAITCIALYCAGHMAIDGQVRYLVPMIPQILYVSMSGLARISHEPS